MSVCGCESTSLDDKGIVSKITDMPCFIGDFWPITVSLPCLGLPKNRPQKGKANYCPFLWAIFAIQPGKNATIGQYMDHGMGGGRAHTHMHAVALLSGPSLALFRGYFLDQVCFF